MRPTKPDHRGGPQAKQAEVEAVRAAGEASRGSRGRTLVFRSLWLYFGNGLSRLCCLSFSLVDLMIVFLILSLFLLMRLKRVKYLPWCFLPLVIVQNEIWLSQAPSFWLGTTLVLLNIGWLILLSAAVARKWPDWDEMTMDRLRRLKG